MSAKDPFPITEAQLTGNFCETLLLGVYLVTCCFCARTLLLTGEGREERWRRLSEIRWLMVTIALALFAICTFDVAIGLLHNFHAFIESKDAKKELLDISDWINIVRMVNNTLAMILGDFVLIYRCWVVYGRRWLVIIPSLVLYLAGIAMAIKLVEIGLDPSIQKNISLNSSQLRPWVSGFFAITAAQNTLTTGILVWRIWRVERQSEKFAYESGSTVHKPGHLRRVMRVIAESGAAYTTMVFITFLVVMSKNNAVYPTTDMTLQATGIAFNVILVRAPARRDQQFTMFDTGERAAISSIHFSDGHTRGSGMPQDVQLTDREVG